MSEVRKHVRVSRTDKVELPANHNSFLFAALVEFVETCRSQGVDDNHYISCNTAGLAYVREQRER